MDSTIKSRDPSKKYVRSRYLDYPKKTSSEDVSRSVFKPPVSSITVPKPVIKASTPKEEQSLGPDFSILSECSIRKPVNKEVPVKLEDQIFESYNVGLLMTAMGMIVDQAEHKFCKKADEQLAMMQKAVHDSECAISDLKNKIDASVFADEIQDSLEFHETTVNKLIGDPAFTDRKGLEDVTAEVERALDWLPCKNLKIPKSQDDLDEIENAAVTLSKSLSSVQLQHGEEMDRVSAITEEILKIDRTCSNLADAQSSIKELMPVATTTVLDKASQQIMESAIANLEIKF